MRRVCLVFLCFVWTALAEPPGAQVKVTVAVPSQLATGPWSSPRTVTVPPGFQFSVWARLDGARFMAVAPNGDVFVSQPSGGAVYVFRPATGGLAQKYQYVTGLNSPHGLAFDAVNGTTYLYIAESSQINRFPYVAGDTTAHGREVIIKGLPDSSLPEVQGSYAHPLKNIAVGPDHRIYVGIGSSCNVCISDASANPVRGSIYVYNSDGSGGRLFAGGLRNPEGLAIIPGTNSLWAAVNNRDQLPYPYADSSNQYDRVVASYVDDHPPEPFTFIRDGGNYGWPFCNPTQDGPSGYDRMKFDPDLDTNLDGHVDCSKMDTINRGFQAHSAPLQLAFSQSTAFPAVYRSGAIMAFHGSWDRVVPTGYKVVYVPLEASSAVPGVQVDIVTGLLEIGSRPAGVAVSQTGSLLISDDATGTIFELTYSAPIVSGPNAYPVIAPNSLASVYGVGLSSQTAAATPPYASSLGNLGLSIVDSAGNSFQPALAYVSPTQINFVMPAAVATGTAKVNLSLPSGTASLGTVQVNSTAPGLFSLDGTGKGTAAAIALDGIGASVPLFSCQGSLCTAVPLDVTGSSKYVSLFGTGVRGATEGSVQVIVNRMPLKPLFVGAQPTYPGLDQINVALPSTFAGSGTVDVQISIGGVLSNTVTITIQ